MESLPDSDPSRRKSRLRRRALHAYRVGVFLFLLLMIRHQHLSYVALERGSSNQPVAVEQVQKFFPSADHLSDLDPAHGGQTVFDQDGERLGFVIQTSPEADRVIGFSGPTNTLVAFDGDRRILGAAVLWSDDTREHLAEILEDGAFLSQWNGLDRDEAAALAEVHAVSGATLTSMAIADGISTRLGRERRTARFPDSITVEEVRPFLESAHAFQPVVDRPFLLRVLDAEGSPIGLASRTSPHADHLLGYQGPSDVLLVLDLDERLVGLALRGTFDNAPYVKLMTDDEYFFNTFIGFDLAEISQLDMVDAGIDGVTGATKTSVTVAESLVLTAMELSRVREPAPPRPLVTVEPRDIGTAVVVVFGLVIALTRWRGHRKLRLAFQVVVVVYLGFLNADMLSQALLVGWAQNGVAWKVAPGLVFLSAAALIAPIATGRQVYCTHLCPFGAVQDWLGRRLPWQLGIKGRLDRVLAVLPVLLLAWVLVVAMAHLPFSLVGIEPFDAFVFRIAGGATIAVAIAGLGASLFVTRAYCRYGCPTGAMLKTLRYGAAPDRFGRRDWVTAGFALLAVGLAVWR